MIGKLDITVHSARGLVSKDTFSKNDPYVYVKVGSHSQKTSVKKNSGKDARWEEVLSFTTSEGKGQTVNISCYDSDVVIDDLIGSTSITVEDLVRRGERTEFELFGKKDTRKITGWVTLSAKFRT